MSTREDYIVRPVRRSDIEDFIGLRELAGPGFTSLMVDDATLEMRLATAEAAFATFRDSPGQMRYLMALQHKETGKVVGSAAVKSSIGDEPPFFNFRILQIAQASAAAQRRFDMDVLILVNEFTKCSEVGSLFVHPDHRAGGVGRMLAQTRYLLMAAEPQRFAPIVVSELRGVVAEDGRSPFWEALGRHFFKMDFAQADSLSANTDNQFILDLMPKYPIYVDLLPFEARAVIGRCHPHGEGALKLLQWEGFRFDRVVDIFDGGPLVSCPRDTIRTFRESRRLVAKTGVLAHPQQALVARTAIDGFRAGAGLVELRGEDVVLSEDFARALNLQPGEDLLIWTGEPNR